MGRDNAWHVPIRAMNKTLKAGLFVKDIKIITTIHLIQTSEKLHAKKTSPQEVFKTFCFLCVSNRRNGTSPKK